MSVPAPVERDYARERIIRTITGSLVALGGVGFAFLNPSIDLLRMPVGFWVALIGAGVVEPTLIFNAIRGGRGDRS